MRTYLGLLAAFATSLCSMDASARDVVIGFAGHSAPFVLPDEDNPGISVEIARGALKLVGHGMKPAFQSYKRIKEEVKQGRLDGAAAMPKGEESLFYSEPCIAFDNVAIVRKRDKIAIHDIGDLPGHNVVAWQNAHEHLGGEFLRLFGRHVRDDYVRKYFDLADQTAQVRMFWSGRADVIVIDDVIFDYMTSTMSRRFRYQLGPGSATASSAGLPFSRSPSPNQHSGTSSTRGSPSCVPKAASSGSIRSTGPPRLSAWQPRNDRRSLLHRASFDRNGLTKRWRPVTPSIG